MERTLLFTIKVDTKDEKKIGAFEKRIKDLEETWNRAFRRMGDTMHQTFTGADFDIDFDIAGKISRGFG